LLRCRFFDKVDNGESVYERIYIYGTTGLIAIREGAAETYIIRDHLGSTRLAIAQDGIAGYAYSYDALGKIIAEGSWGNATSLAWARYFYTGQERDEETGLQNFRARFYDEDLFRFYAMDPAGQQISPYAFSGNSPLVFIDRNGEEFFTIAALTAKLNTVAKGAAIYGGVQAAGDAIRGNINSWSSFGNSLGRGALRGAMAGLTGGGSALDMFANAVGSQLPSYNLSVGNFNFSISPNFGFGSEGMTFGADMAGSFRMENGGTIGGSVGGFLNTGGSGLDNGGLFGSGSMFGGYTSDKFSLMASSSQTVGILGNPDYSQGHDALRLTVGKFSLAYSNDDALFGMRSNSSDKGRTASLEAGWGDYRIGWNINTTDRQGRGDDNRKLTEEVVDNGKTVKYYKGGKALSSPLYIGFVQDGMQTRLGIDVPAIQSFFQNGLHDLRDIPRFKEGNYRNIYGSHRRHNPFIW
jgi:RHS repeat-associated protein